MTSRLLERSMSMQCMGLCFPPLWIIQNYCHPVVVQYHEYSDPSERTASQHGSNKGAVLLLLSSRTWSSSEATDFQLRKTSVASHLKLPNGLETPHKEHVQAVLKRFAYADNVFPWDII